MKDHDILEALGNLGLRPGATLHDCQEAYHRHTRNVHPDSYAAGSWEQQEAHEKQENLNAAWELVQKADLKQIAASYGLNVKAGAGTEAWDKLFKEARQIEDQGDTFKAADCYKRLADQGCPKAQFRLGYIYFDSILKDLPQAIFWWRRAADQGHVPSQYNLGLMYEQGLGTPMDVRQAVHWFEQAAQKGDAKAKKKLDSISGATIMGMGMPVIPPVVSPMESSDPRSVLPKMKSGLASDSQAGAQAVKKHPEGENLGRAFIHKKK